MSDILSRDRQVINTKFGSGRVVLDNGDTVIVRFDHGLEECARTSLELVTDLQEVMASEAWQPPLEVITRAQAAAILSVNDAWGVFSLSRIALLPHQLWVCRQVRRTWPMRWLVADDVGLGKTIEAGLVLMPLLSSGLVRRLLVLCPKSLVEQWQHRLRTMFDIRLAEYVAEADTDRGDFWGTHNQVVASLQTLRLDRKGRHERMLTTDPWDLLIVDEAHHLNADEEAGPTLGYKLIQRLIEEKRLESLLFFTGTPHRGKDFGFLALLRLLRSDLFDPRKPIGDQLPRLRDVMIRNNKQNVTNLQGERLFKAPQVTSETYAYSPSESNFYRMLTEFITTGKAYASGLAEADGRMVMLVLITMQKLASSSVAAIRRALEGRLQRMGDHRTRLDDLRARLKEYEAIEGATGDDLAPLEEEIASISASVSLMKNEEARLRELVQAAREVREETKITKIVDLLRGLFAERQVVFFTEYKATQALVMSAINQVFGDGRVTFINGDNRIDGVVSADGTVRSVTERRENAADKFNAGEVRFLVSTEAGGEGIDLQERCHTMIHVDLPWNPMRLHQRVGRLNRYGQTKRVEVLTLRNPDTVESRIWNKLNTKLHAITTAFRHAMEEPEDLLQLVLGMSSPSVFRELFADASSVPEGRLDEWFDAKTVTLGGRDVVKAVEDLVGHCSRFDFQVSSPHIPPLDLPALRPFVEAMVTHNRRKIHRDGETISFKTPEVWRTEPGVTSTYEDMVFDRNVRGREAVRHVLGVGHRVVDQALRQAVRFTATLTALPATVLEHPLIVFKISDRITGEHHITKTAVAGVEFQEGGERLELLKDWQVLERLNRLCAAPGAGTKSPPRPVAAEQVKQAIEQASDFLESRLSALDLGFQIPHINVLGLFWPLAKEQRLTLQTADAETGQRG